MKQSYYFLNSTPLAHPEVGRMMRLATVSPFLQLSLTSNEGEN